MQTKFITLLIATACLLGQQVVADGYSTDATMSLQKDEGTLNVDVRVSRLSQQEGKPVEQLVEAPRIITGPGVPATLRSGPQPGDSDYASKEHVTVEVSWPYPNESGVALCAVTVKRGDKVVSNSKLQLKIEGPGRSPLVLAVQDVDPKSLRLITDDPKFCLLKTCLLLEFAGKSKAEVKKLAVENYGNRVQIRDSQGRLTEGGRSFGAYNGIGLTLHYDSEDEAKHVASILRGETAK